MKIFVKDFLLKHLIYFSPYLSASYRIQIANVAKLAIGATDHCTLLHAGTVLSSPRQSRWPLGTLSPGLVFATVEEQQNCPRLR